ncbi:hypothetical protein [Lutibaculum baratangense]|uniref:Uncharacterized protein n=1 Tax=Lutibaculum baratangense AMV1 TaxID=631454 RepID=V4RP12_9HYPH|nr:hypothetical protein [Lutibaculum baratangense]ESR24905.1 hypothetical protein N177_2228 [Lutibaculum baratangense AMV1]
MTLTRSEVTEVLGPVGNTLAADIIATGATRQELLEAWMWVNSDEALVGEGRELPRGRVAQLADLLAPQDDEDL